MSYIIEVGIGVVGVFVGVVMTYYYAKKREWYLAKESLLSHISDLYLGLEALAKAPNLFNQYSIQFLFAKEAGYISNVGTYFW